MSRRRRVCLGSRPSSQIQPPSRSRETAGVASSTVSTLRLVSAVYSPSSAGEDYGDQGSADVCRAGRRPRSSRRCRDARSSPYRRCWHRRSAASRRHSRTCVRQQTSERAGKSSPIPAAGFNPCLHVARVEAEKVAPLHERDTSFADEAANVACADAEVLGNLFDRQEAAELGSVSRSFRRRGHADDRGAVQPPRSSGVATASGIIDLFEADRAAFVALGGSVSVCARPPGSFGGSPILIVASLCWSRAMRTMESDGGVYSQAPAAGRHPLQRRDGG